MVLEVQILRFCLKVFSFLIIPIFFFIYYFFIREIFLSNEYFIIKKNDSHINIIDRNINDNSFNLITYKLILKMLLYSDIKIHHGKFEIENKINFINLIKIITSPSSFYEKITIIEGSSKTDLNENLNIYFDNFEQIEYSEAISDTYLFSYGATFEDFEKIIQNRFIKIKEKYQDNDLLDRFSFNEIMIIGSLLEKEGLDYLDKKKIFSVIINRLNKNMKLQIDATVIFSITKGITKLNRKLTYDDLKIEDPYNTYFNYGLPPEPISYVGYKTIELIFENYKTNYLFYFYNSIEKKHIFSVNYKDHLKSLNEYRSKK